MAFFRNYFKHNSVKKISGDLSNNFQKESYSQSGEDLIVDFIFNAIGIYSPSYIDIGAHHPYYLNNTYIFYKRGCRGINIEPDPALFDFFEKERGCDKNLNVGIASNSGVLDFYIMNTPTLNTFSKKESEKYSKEGNYYVKEIKKINVTNIAKVIAEHNGGIFPDFLTLDAEGVDEIVLKSIDYNNNKPIVICAESISFSEKGEGIKNIELIRFIESKGYMLYADTNINSIFVETSKWKRG
jgi:FkbM family methyltransferase